ncbi:MAG: DsbA family protein [Pikeienuella sp.]
MSIDPHRRALFSGTFALLAATALPAPAQEQDTPDATAPEPNADTTADTTADAPTDATPSDGDTGVLVGDVAIGADDAPVTIIEYASFTCPHCADFHIDTWPEIKRRYVDTGKVRFVLREIYFDRFGLWASIVARCGGAAGFYPLTDAILKAQRDWMRADDVVDGLMKVGRINGLTTERMRACLSDREAALALVEGFRENSARDQVQSTPTFLINGQAHRGNMDIEEFSELIEGALQG